MAAIGVGLSLPPHDQVHHGGAQLVVAAVPSAARANCKSAVIWARTRRLTAQIARRASGGSSRSSRSVHGQFATVADFGAGAGVAAAATAEACGALCLGAESFCGAESSSGVVCFLRLPRRGANSCPQGGEPLGRQRPHPFLDQLHVRAAATPSHAATSACVSPHCPRCPFLQPHSALCRGLVARQLHR